MRLDQFWTVALILSLLAGGCTKNEPAQPPEANARTDTAEPAAERASTSAQAPGPAQPLPSGCAEAGPVHLAPSALLPLLPSSALVDRDWFAEAAGTGLAGYVHAEGLVVTAAAELLVSEQEPVASPMLTRVWRSGQADRTGPFGRGWHHDLGPHSGRCRQDALCDDRGRVLWLLGPGNETRLRWQQDRVVELRPNVGRPLFFDYDDQGRVTAIRRDDQVLLACGYDARGNLVSASRTGDPGEYRYDDQGRLTERRGKGPTWKAAWNDRGQLASLTGPGDLRSRISLATANGQTRLTAVDALGREVRITHAADGSQTLTDALGRVTRNQFDPKGRLVLTEAPGGQRRTYTWDAEGRLTAAVYPGGHARGFVYRENRLVEIRGLAGTLRITYGDDGWPSRVTDEEDRTTTYRRDSCGRLLELAEATGRTLRYTRDAKGRITAIEDGHGQREVRVYGGDGRPSEVTDVLGRTTRFAWHPDGTLASITHPDGSTEKWQWDDLGRLTGWTDRAGQEARLQHDALGRVTAFVRQDAHLRTEYDAAGRLVRAETPDGPRMLEWDAADRLVRIVEPSGRDERLVYDDADRITERWLGGRRVGLTRYDEQGRPTRQEDGEGSAAEYRYDDLGRLAAITSRDGTAAMTYAPDGSITVHNEPQGPTLQLSPTGFDGLLRQVQAEWPGGPTTHWEYDAAGQLRRRTTDGGEEVRWDYDAAGRLRRMESTRSGNVELGWDPVGRLTRIAPQGAAERGFTYDGAGRLAGATIGRNEYRYDYSPTGQLLAINRGDDLLARFTYGPAGRLAGRSDAAGRTFATTWNRAGQLTSWSRPDGRVEHFQYDELGRLSRWQLDQTILRTNRWSPAGRLERCESAGLVSRFGYDTAGRLLRKAVGDHAVTRRLDEKGRLSARLVDDREALHYDRDEHGRLQAIRGPADARVGFGYDDLGRVATLQLGPAATIRYSYDEAGRVNAWHLERSGDSPQLAARYERDSRGRLAATTLNETRRDYRYDDQDRLASVTTKPGKPIACRYDDHGHLVQVGEQPVVRDATGQATATSAGPNTLGPQGEPTTMARPEGPLELRWTDAGQLAGLLRSGRQMVGYDYDCDGRLARRRTPAGETSLLQDDGLLASWGTQGERLYLLGPEHSQPLGFVVDDQAYYFVPDLDGTILAVVDQQGIMVNQYRYGPFGEPLQVDEQVANPLRFQGHWQEPESGLLHFRMRWYDPRARSFLTADPMAGDLLRPETFNRFAFLENDPINKVDPWGTEAYEWQQGASTLEHVCNLFQWGKIQASYAMGKTLDGYKYTGAIDKGGWVYDVWLKKVPGSDRVLTIFRDLNEKAEGPYGKPNFTGNIVLQDTPPTATPAATSAAKPQPGGIGASIRQTFNNVKHGVQLYGKEVTGTVTALGGTWGTLNTSVTTIAALPGGVGIIGAAVVGSGLGGYLVGTLINKIPGVSKAATWLFGKATGANTEQLLVTEKLRDELMGERGKEIQKETIAKNMAEFKASGLPFEAPDPGQAAGTVEIGGPPPQAEPAPDTGKQAGETGDQAGKQAEPAPDTGKQAEPAPDTGKQAEPAPDTGKVLGSGPQEQSEPTERDLAEDEDKEGDEDQGDEHETEDEGDEDEPEDEGDEEVEDKGDEDQGDEEGEDEGEIPRDLADYPFYQITISYKTEEDASFQEFKNTVTCTYALSFWNVGARVPGKGGAVLSHRCVASINGSSAEGKKTGTFTGGPNGKFRFPSKEGDLIFYLNGGQSVTIPGAGTFPNPNPAAFEGFPN